MKAANEARGGTEVLDVSEHLVGCPAERIESYTTRGPLGQDVGIIRCIDCGASDVVAADGIKQSVNARPAYVERA